MLANLLIKGGGSNEEVAYGMLFGLAGRCFFGFRCAC